MAILDSKGSIKSFLVQYLVGLVAFFGFLIGISTILQDPENIGIDSEGTLELGPPQTYFETMYSIGPEVLVLTMILSSCLVWFMTNLRKGIEALIIGIVCSLFIGFFITTGIEQALYNNFNDVTDATGSVEIDSRAIFASHLFIGNLFLWANFLLELIRFKPKPSLTE